MGLFRHGVEGDVIGIINEDEVIELIVTGKGDRFFGDAFLEATVTVEGDDVVIKEGVFRGVEFCGGAFTGEGEAGGVGDALTEGTGGGFNPNGVAELGVTGSLGAKDAEVFEFIQ